MRRLPALALPALVLPVLALQVLGLSALGGCRLIDQRTFEGTGVFPEAAQLHAADFAMRALPPPPLAVVRLGTPDVDWQDKLIEAARDARGRKPDVQFDVVTPVPSLARLDVQDKALRQGAADAAEVATALEWDGVSADSIHIGSRGDRGDPPREVEVYVR